MTNLSHSDLLKELAAIKKENRNLKQEIVSLEKKLKASSVDESIIERDAQLMKYNKELEQFTYVATHDLKTPLANIQGYLDLLELDLPNPTEDVADSLKWLKYSVVEAQEVIRALTNALKARNSKEELLSPINLDELVESILSGMRSRILEQAVVIISDFTEINHFMYYPVALRSILQNIISNAIQYSSKNETPEIIIKTEQNEDQIMISIKDNGVGMDLTADGGKVFGLFKRVSNDENGSGIGMYIVNKLLENYGGQLKVESQLGRGSTFTVILPFNKNQH